MLYVAEVETRVLNLEYSTERRFRYPYAIIMILCLTYKNSEINLNYGQHMKLAS